MVETITSLLVPPGQVRPLLSVNHVIQLGSIQSRVHNQRRFHCEFGLEEPASRVVPKPSSFTATFTGNTDDCFKVGVAVRGKAVHLYADFYSSDIIVASPLGLRTVIGAEGYILYITISPRK